MVWKYDICDSIVVKWYVESHVHISIIVSLSYQTTYLVSSLFQYIENNDLTSREKKMFHLQVQNMFLQSYLLLSL